jgi:hypothetical protein
MLSITWLEYLKREATDVFNVLLVALVALTIWAVLWFSPTVIDHITQWYYTNIDCVEGAPSSKTLGDVIRSRSRCAWETRLNGWHALGRSA